jgi:primase-polymerase (primpol)-like protein
MRKLSSALKPMMDLDQWVNWKRLLNGEKPPFQAARPAKYASPTDPRTWSSYRTAVAAAPAKGGIGFALKGSGIGALDLDDCRDAKTGKLDNWAEEIVRKARDAYVEVSGPRQWLSNRFRKVLSLTLPAADGLRGAIPT